MEKIIYEIDGSLMAVGGAAMVVEELSIFLADTTLPEVPEGKVLRCTFTVEDPYEGD